MSRAEHASVNVRDLDEACEFYTERMGLVEIARTGDAVYLGCGTDPNYDIAIREGGTGLGHLAFRATDRSVDEYADAFDDADVPYERRDGEEPHRKSGVRVSLPSGAPIEMVEVAETRYDTPYHPRPHALDGRSELAPVDLDHFMLTSPSVKRDAEFLQDVLGFELSDVATDEEGNWRAAWLRLSARQHELAIIFHPQASQLHHVAWQTSSVEHTKQLLDSISEFGGENQPEVELGIGRHNVGGNLYAYFLEPGGNRFEFSCEMARVDEDHEPRTWLGPSDAFFGWRDDTLPESFTEGS